MKSHFKITFIYTVFGVLWILFSDWFVDLLTDDPSTLTRIQDLKGIAFIVFTALLLYLLLKREFSIRERAEKKVLEQKKITQEYLDNANVIIIVGDVDGKVRVANKAACEVFQCENGSLIGEDFIEKFVYEDSKGKIKNMYFNMLEKETLPVKHLEIPLKAANGNRIVVSWRNGFVRDEEGKIKFVIASGIDITEKKAIEEELSEYREHLEKLVEERTVELRKVNKELEAFSYSVSHDLRTPLTIISGYAETLMDNYSKELGDEGGEFVEKLINASERMSEIIEDLLRLSRINRSEIKREHVNLSSIAREIAQSLEDTDLERKNVDFIIEEGIEADCDKRLMTIVLENLMKNSWKFTSRHENAKIEFGVKRESERTVYFIKDDGAGFDMSKYEQLFGAFNRLHSSRDFQGTGIGLAIVKRIIQKHEGKIWAQSKLEEGATFSFTLEKIN